MTNLRWKKPLPVHDLQFKRIKIFIEELRRYSDNRRKSGAMGLLFQFYFAAISCGAVHYKPIEIDAVGLVAEVQHKT
ncbi:MAG: hypothetical protein JSS64_08385 [Bacteroidetes bacterium]|nr:hypothetical protein [Bacteroidota bacterium]